MLKIIKYPHKALRKKARPVKQITAQIKQFSQDLLSTLNPETGESLGVGLAASQVNKPLRIFVLKMPASTQGGGPASPTNGPDDKFEIIINPRILKSSKKMFSSLPEKQQFLEGCLSFPNYYGFVDRPVKIKVTYQTINGLNKQKTLTLPHSIYFQHEVDHLNGILFIDYIKKNKEHVYIADKKGKLSLVTDNPFK